MVLVSLIKAALTAAARWLQPEAGASLQVPVRACFKHVFDGRHIATWTRDVAAQQRTEGTNAGNLAPAQIMADSFRRSP
jgi:hypothetical protein